MYTQVDNLFMYNLKTSDTLRYTCIELQQQFSMGLSSEQGDSNTNFQLWSLTLFSDLTCKLSICAHDDVNN